MTARVWFDIVSLLVATLGCGAPATPRLAPRDTASAAPPEQAASAAKTRVEIGFRSEQALAAHWRKHGAEFPGLTRADYLAAAERLRDAPATGSVLEATRADRVITRFDRASGAFLAFDPDGTIRTFFKPSDGEAYFRRQLRRR